MNDELIIPFATWVEAICIYLEEGTQGLVKAIDKPKEFGKTSGELAICNW